MKMDDVRKCSQCKTFFSKSNFCIDVCTKDGLNPIWKICRRGYFNEKFDKTTYYRKQNEKSRKESDINFILAFNVRSRTIKAFKAQKVGKTNETLDLLGCSHSFSKVGSGHSSNL